MLGKFNIKQPTNTLYQHWENISKNNTKQRYHDFMGYCMFHGVIQYGRVKCIINPEYIGIQQKECLTYINEKRLPEKIVN